MRQTVCLPDGECCRGKPRRGRCVSRQEGSQFLCPVNFALASWWKTPDLGAGIWGRREGRHVGLWGKSSGQNLWQVQRPSGGGFLAHLWSSRVAHADKWKGPQEESDRAGRSLLWPGTGEGGLWWETLLVPPPLWCGWRRDCRGACVSWETHDQLGGHVGRTRAGATREGVLGTLQGSSQRDLWLWENKNSLGRLLASGLRIVVGLVSF